MSRSPWSPPRRARGTVGKSPGQLEVIADALGKANARARLGMAVQLIAAACEQVQLDFECFRDYRGQVRQVSGGLA